MAALRGRLRAFVTQAATRVNAAWQRLTCPLPLVTGVAQDVLRTRSELVAENALLRQQLIIASRKVKTPALEPRERGLLVLLSRWVPLWRDALLLVKPATLLRWRRAGFRLFWRHRSRTVVVPQRVRSIGDGRRCVISGMTHWRRPTFTMS